MKWIRTQDIWQLICSDINGRYSSPNINIKHAYGLGYLAIKNIKLCDVTFITWNCLRFKYWKTLN